MTNMTLTKYEKETIILFNEGEEVDTLLGWQQIGNDIGYIIMALACGYLTLLGWRYAFAVHAGGIISLILTIMFFPKDSEGHKTEAHKVEGKTHLTGAAIFWLLFVLAFSYVVRHADKYPKLVKLFVKSSYLVDKPNRY